MEEIQIVKTGDRVEQMCVTCNEERGHIVASVTTKGRITRVSCPICGSRVPYKKGTTRRASVKAGAPHHPARSYRKRQNLLHSTVWEGGGTGRLEPNKKNDMFGDGMRRVIHS